MKPGSKASKAKRRFPRLAMSSEERACVKILIHTYNRVAERGNVKKGGGRSWYDIRKTKRGKFTEFQFQMLAQDLVKHKIDPAVYVQVLSQYGRFSRAGYMPHPKWMSSEKAFEVYEWMHRRERGKYVQERDWKRARKGKERDHILAGIKTSAAMIADVRSTLGLRTVEAVMFMRDEVSPPYLLCVLRRNKGNAGALEALLARETRREIAACLRYFMHNRSDWRAAKKQYTRSA